MIEVSVLYICVAYGKFRILNMGHALALRDLRVNTIFHPRTMTFNYALRNQQGEIPCTKVDTDACNR